jgi:hypothetical protein
MGRKCSIYGEFEGRPVGISRKSARMVLKPIIKEIKCKVLDWIQLAQDTVK